MIAETSERYSHQLYFFSDEAKEIRDYFGGLLYNTTTINDHQTKNLYNFDELSQKVAVLTQKSDCYKIINSMLKTENALKIVIALLFKGFSWTNELTNHFNISRKLYVTTTLHSLQKLNLIIKEKGIRLNPYYFEAIEKSNSVQIRKALHQTDMYYITDDFLKFCSLLKELFEYKVQESEAFRFSLRDIVEDAKKFQFFYDRIMDEETTLNEREHIADDGTLYVTETLRSKNIKKSLKIALNELKQEQLEAKEQQNLLSDHERGQLALIRESGTSLAVIEKDEQIEKYKKLKKPLHTYNGEEIRNPEKILEKQKKEDEQIEKAQTIIGNPKLSDEKSIFDGGLYLSESARKEWLQAEEKEKPKSAEEEFDAIFAGIGVSR